MKTYVNMLPFLLINTLAFYLLPFLNVNAVIGILILLIIFPLLIYITSFLFGLKNRLSVHNFVYVIINSLLFLPTIFIHFNETAWIFLGLYFILSIVGMLIGVAVGKKQAVTAEVD